MVKVWSRSGQGVVVFSCWSVTKVLWSRCGQGVVKVWMCPAGGNPGYDK